MSMESMIERINQLYNKAKTEGLTEEESKEQKKLREEYIKIFRSNFRSQLENTKIKELDGTIRPLRRKK